MKRKRKLSLQDYYNVATREMVVIFTSHLSRKWTGLLGIDCSAHIQKKSITRLTCRYSIIYWLRMRHPIDVGELTCTNLEN